MKRFFVSVVSALAFAVLLLTPSLANHNASTTAESSTPAFKTTTPIKHLVVIFQENVSFDHYFGTYPYATNPSGEPKFTPAPNTPTVNGLTQTLLTHNPNEANPVRLDRSEALTCDQDHGYTAEQEAFATPLPTRVPSCASSKTTGERVVSATSPLTPWPELSPTCSISPARTPTNLSLIPRWVSRSSLIVG